MRNIFPSRGRFQIVYLMSYATLLILSACNGSTSDSTINPENVTPVSINAVDTQSFYATSNSGGRFSNPLDQTTYTNGISVTGTASMDISTDLAVLKIGVEALAKKVVDARNQAAESMTNIISTLEDFRIPEKNIETLHFSIAPRYEYKDHKQVMVGYNVTNQVSVKVDNTDTLGSIIDAITEAGGDITRVHSIRFFAENTALLEKETRSIAINNMTEKAQQFADLTGIRLGRPIYLTEGSPINNMNLRTMSSEIMYDGNSTTPISSGQLTITSTVHGIFAIEW